MSLAHTLAGLATSLGAHALRLPAQALEQAAHARNTSEAQRALAHTDALLSPLQDALNRRLRSAAPAPPAALRSATADDANWLPRLPGGNVRRQNIQVLSLSYSVVF